MMIYFNKDGVEVMLEHKGNDLFQFNISDSKSKISYKMKKEELFRALGFLSLPELVESVESTPKAKKDNKQV